MNPQLLHSVKHCIRRLRIAKTGEAEGHRRLRRQQHPLFLSKHAVVLLAQRFIISCISNLRCKGILKQQAHSRSDLRQRSRRLRHRRKTHCTHILERHNLHALLLAGRQQTVSNLHNILMLHSRTLAQLQRRLLVNRRTLINFALLLLYIFNRSADNNRNNAARLNLRQLLFCLSSTRHSVDVNINIALHCTFQAAGSTKLQQRHIIIRFRRLEQRRLKITRNLEHLLRHAQLLDNLVLRHLVQLRHTDIGIVAKRLSLVIDCFNKLFILSRITALGKKGCLSVVLIEYIKQTVKRCLARQSVKGQRQLLFAVNLMRYDRRRLQCQICQLFLGGSNFFISSISST